MESLLERVPQGSNVAVIRLRSLGDCVLTTPALHLLKNFRPDLRMAVAVEDRFAAIFHGNPDVAATLPASIAAVRAWRPALCINFHGGTRSAALTVLSGARFRAGFGHFPFRSVYNVRIPRAQQILGEERTVHTAEHLASAMIYMGVPRVDIPRARLFASGGTEIRNAAVVHPFASAPQKTWSAEGFRAVAQQLRSGGLEPVFIGSPSDDLSAFAEFRCMAGAPLEDVKALMSGAVLFVGNDSGPAHIAAAFGVPCVVLFGSSDPAIWGPWRTASAVLTGAGGIASIRVADVLAALDRVRVAA